MIIVHNLQRRRIYSYKSAVENTIVIARHVIGAAVSSMRNLLPLAGGICTAGASVWADTMKSV